MSMHIQSPIVRQDEVLIPEVRACIPLVWHERRLGASEASLPCPAIVHLPGSRAAPNSMMVGSSSETLMPTAAILIS